MSALTPGHFLIGSAVNAVPEPSLAKDPTSRLLRWQQVQQIRDHFCKRWSHKYLHTLASRQMWKSDAAPRVGDLCVICDEHTPPGRWPLARVTAIHPGDDSEVRQ